MTWQGCCLLALLAIALGLVGCFESHDRADDARLRDQARDGSGAGAGSTPPPQGGAERKPDEDDAPDGEPTPPSDRAAAMDDQPVERRDAAAAAMTGTDPELQVWLGETAGEYTDCAMEIGHPFIGIGRQRLLLLLQLDAGGEVEAASVTVGEGTPPPPATDPDAFYPQDAEDWQSSLCPLSNPVAGFEYPAHGARIDDARLSLTFYAADFYGSWCALQQSYPASVTAENYFGIDHMCRPSDPIQDLDGVNAAINGAQDLTPEALCLGESTRACDCDAERCRARRALPSILDLLVDGDTMEGRLVTHILGTVEVRMLRVRP